MANFVFTNLQIFREGGCLQRANLIKGMVQLAEDIAAGDGHLKLRQTDYRKFIIGKNIASIPRARGSRKHVCEIIHYAPTT